MIIDKIVNSIPAEDIVDVVIEENRIIIPKEVRRKEITNTSNEVELSNLKGIESILYHSVGKNKRNLKSVSRLLITGGR